MSDILSFMKVAIGRLAKKALDSDDDAYGKFATTCANTPDGRSVPISARNS
jgi:hypothetical protein